MEKSNQDDHPAALPPRKERSKPMGGEAGLEKGKISAPAGKQSRSLVTLLTALPSLISSDASCSGARESLTLC